MKILSQLRYTIVSCLLGMSCTGNGHHGTDAISTGNPITAEDLNFHMDTLHTGLENPWGITWLPDGRMLVTERKGEILVFEKGHHNGEKLSGFPEVYERGQGGLLDIQVHPHYSENGWIYATYAKPGKEGGSTTLVRFRLSDHQISDMEILYQTMPLSTSGVHFGSRIVFDEAGYLYFSTGERGTKANAQDLTNDMGKIHRLHDDGRVPSDNPFLDNPAAKPSIWSYGHRNVQGMAYDRENRILYATEHGPRGGDELNIIEKGKNYGWPIITYGIDYSGAIISELTEKEGMEQPIHYWTPSIATCGLLYYTGDRYTNWRGNLFSGALALTHVARIELSNGKYRHEEKLLSGIGRVRQVAQDPDGFIWVLTEGPGMLLKLVPAE
ncbi:PQQ-dependent sugar dehydrogenase [Parapedobacter koreensis]|uniref:Glucose/arabinose dehydrogenase, beta-propeller fold n=1 Tax=Parapedobacter koreensis TaxID=332977 RepID=A0A1H7I533_9SPHI|nr:PQQ-dependent sugar dehydrogenase [Parapedobacter koreensis]SEK57661.1 Glucose/arabinose dehydrogenase, beta-propeller fold [Parapedobacter koreensis]